MRALDSLRMAGALLLAGTFAPSLTHAAPRKISLDDAVTQALRENLDLAASDAAERATEADAKATRGNLLPKFTVTGNALFFDSAFNATFPLSIDPSVIASLPPVGQQVLGALAPAFSTPIHIRDEHTEMIGVQATEPLVALYGITERWKAQQQLAAAAKADGVSLRAEIVYRTTESYLRLLQAIDIERVARETITDIEEQVRIAHALVEAGTLIKADQLRAEVQLAQSKQDLLRADAQVGIARAVLASLIGAPVDEELEPERLLKEVLPQLPASDSAPVEDAVKNRPELKAAHERAGAADRLRKAAWSDLAPQINVEARFEHVEGFSRFFQKPDVFFGGVFLQWNFWEWGTQFYAAEAAKHRASAAGVDEARRRRDVALDARRRYLEARAAFAAIEVTRDAVASAREARRVTKALYENGSATTTDLLNAELSLENARVNDARSTYDALVAFAALSRASGAAGFLPRTTSSAPSDEDRSPLLRAKTPIVE